MSPSVLLATIGERDPVVDDQPMGPLRAALTLRPSTVVLVHTEGTAPNALATRERIEVALERSTVELRRLEGDPSDREQVLEQCRDLVEELRKAGKFRRDWTVEVCTTSGTPQMGAALTVAVAARYPGARHWQALNPRYATGPELLRRDRPVVLWMLTHVADGLRLLRTGRPAEALGAMEGYRDFDLLGRSLPYVRVAVALARLLDRVAEYRLSELAGCLDELRAAAETAPRLGASVTRLAAWYDRVVSELAQRPSARPTWPLELAASAAREFEGGHRVPGVLELAAAAQVAYRARLHGRHGIDASDLGPNRERVVGLLPEGAVKLAEGRWYIDGWRRELELLRGLEAGALRGGGAQLERANRLARLRNELLHTGSGTTAEELDAAFTDGRLYVDWLFGSFGWGRLDDVPSMPTGVQAAVNSLADDARITVTG